MLRHNETHVKDIGEQHNLQTLWAPFTLKEALYQATIPFEYVHRAESRRLEYEGKADEIWS